MASNEAKKSNEKRSAMDDPNEASKRIKASLASVGTGEDVLLTLKLKGVEESCHQLEDKIQVCTEKDSLEDTNEQETSQRTPLSILESIRCKAQTLTVSDQHVTLLLNHGNGSAQRGEQGCTSKSILKLTTVPFHKEILGSNPITVYGETCPRESDPIASQNIISFLQKYDFGLKSESGAEYGYYSATPSAKFYPQRILADTDKNTSSISTHSSEAEGMLENEGIICTRMGSFDVELISPATERQIQRVMPLSSSSLINETPIIYENVTKPYIKTITEGKSLNWIQNILDGRKEQERLLVDTDSYIINIDTKWKSHPDPLKVSKEEWHEHTSVVDLYCLGIFKESGIATLRDLRARHIPILQSMNVDGLKIIDKIYGVKKDQVRIFVHYHPQFYQFHVHFTRLHNEIGAQVERGHLLTDIIQNLELDSDYYKKRTITYKLRISHPLCKLIQDEEMNSSASPTS